MKNEDANLPITSRSNRADQERAAIELASRHGVTIVLKGHRSLITDGRASEHNSTGNPGMARGGSGDVLTGIIAALVAQGLSAFDAARLGAHVHGLAGDLAAAALGHTGMIARDLVDHLPQAWGVTSREPPRATP
jgi:NAD(P)H-hydrate epimerase